MGVTSFRKFQRKNRKHTINNAIKLLYKYFRKINGLLSRYPYLLACWIFVFSCTINSITRVVLKHEYQLIRRSNFFDSNWYLSYYSDIQITGLKPITHYIWFGWREMRDPSPLFCTSYYLSHNLDIYDEEVNPLVHFIVNDTNNSWPRSSPAEQKSSIIKKNESNSFRSQKNQKIDCARRYPNILFIGHEATYTGAPLVLLYLIQWLSANTLSNIFLILLRGGSLLPEYSKVSHVLCLKQGFVPPFEVIKNFVQEPGFIYVNTVVSAELIEILTKFNKPIITHVHELDKLIRMAVDNQTMISLAKNSSSIIAVSDPVAQNLVQSYGCQEEKIEIIHDFIKLSSKSKCDKEALRSFLSLPIDGKIVVGCGLDVWRKGVDIFVSVAQAVLSASGKKDIFFIWVGELSPPLEGSSLGNLVKSNLYKEQILFPGFSKNPRDYFSAADIFLLPSREDPFPLVALEACECSLPVICFENSGGMPDFIRNGAGYVVPFEDAEAMAKRVIFLLAHDEIRMSIGNSAREKLLKSHISEIAIPKVLKICQKHLNFHLIKEY
nr:glycosyltransferase family 4 protein [uncultured Methanospirillum sp.]